MSRNNSGSLPLPHLIKCARIEAITWITILTVYIYIYVYLPYRSLLDECVSSPRSTFSRCSTPFRTVGLRERNWGIIALGTPLFLWIIAYSPSVANIGYGRLEVKEVLFQWTLANTCKCNGFLKNAELHAQQKTRSTRLKTCIPSKTRNRTVQHYSISGKNRILFLPHQCKGLLFNFPKAPLLCEVRAFPNSAPLKVPPKDGSFSTHSWADDHHKVWSWIIHRIP